MRECFCFSVLFLRLLPLCVAKAVNLELFLDSEASTLSPSALIECTPHKCSKHLDCSWKYCPTKGYVPKCIEGKYTETCCMCEDEWPSVLSLMMSSTCSNMQPLLFKKGYYNNHDKEPPKLCNQTFKHNIRSGSNKLTQRHAKFPNNKFKYIFPKKRSYLEFEINKIHKKERLLHQIRRIYDVLSEPQRSDDDTTDDSGISYFSSNNTNLVNTIQADDYYMTKITTTNVPTTSVEIRTTKSHMLKNNKSYTTHAISYTSKGAKIQKKVLKKYNSDSQNTANRANNDIPNEYISNNGESKVLMGNKLVG